MVILSSCFCVVREKTIKIKSIVNIFCMQYVILLFSNKNISNSRTNTGTSCRIRAESYIQNVIKVVLKSVALVCIKATAL